MEVILRQYTPGDLQWLVAAHGELYARQFQFDAEFAVDIAHKLERFFENCDDFSRIYIAESGTEKIGSIAVSLWTESTAFINFFLVREKYQGWGVGRQLMEKVLLHIRENEIDYLRLEAYSCLEAARKLYANYGFSLCERRKDIQKYSQIFDQEFWEKSLVW